MYTVLRVARMGSTWPIGGIRVATVFLIGLRVVIGISQVSVLGMAIQGLGIHTIGRLM